MLSFCASGHSYLLAGPNNLPLILATSTKTAPIHFDRSYWSCDCILSNLDVVIWFRQMSRIFSSSYSMSGLCIFKCKYHCYEQRTQIYNFYLEEIKFHIWFHISYLIFFFRKIHKYVAKDYFWCQKWIRTWWNLFIICGWLWSWFHSKKGMN